MDFPPLLTPAAGLDWLARHPDDWQPPASPALHEAWERRLLEATMLAVHPRLIELARAMELSPSAARLEQGAFVLEPRKAQGSMPAFVQVALSLQWKGLDDQGPLRSIRVATPLKKLDVSPAFAAPAFEEALAAAVLQWSPDGRRLWKNGLPWEETWQGALQAWASEATNTGKGSSAFFGAWESEVRACRLDGALSDAEGPSRRGPRL